MDKKYLIYADKRYKLFGVRRLVNPKDHPQLTPRRFHKHVYYSRHAWVFDVPKGLVENTVHRYLKRPVALDEVIRFLTLIGNPRDTIQKVLTSEA